MAYATVLNGCIAAWDKGRWALGVKPEPLLSGVEFSGMEQLSRLTPATVDVLRALEESMAPIWGLQVVKNTGRPSGSVYPILDRLERINWVQSSWEEQTDRQGPRRRYYELTDGGRAAARQAVREYENRASRGGPLPRLSAGGVSL